MTGFVTVGPMGPVFGPPRMGLHLGLTPLGDPVMMVMMIHRRGAAAVGCCGGPEGSVGGTGGEGVVPTLGERQLMVIPDGMGGVCRGGTLTSGLRGIRGGDHTMGVVHVVDVSSVLSHAKQLLGRFLKIFHVGLGHLAVFALLKGRNQFLIVLFHLV